MHQGLQSLKCGSLLSSFLFRPSDFFVFITMGAMGSMFPDPRPPVVEVWSFAPSPDMTWPKKPPMDQEIYYHT